MAEYPRGGQGVKMPSSHSYLTWTKGLVIEPKAELQNCDTDFMAREQGQHSRLLGREHLRPQEM